jgi:integrase
MDRYRGHSNSFIKWLGQERVKKPLESVTTQDARLWVESILDTGVVGKTAQSYAKDLGSIYRSAIREGLVMFNPFTALETIDTSDSHERKPFTTSEVIALMQAAPTWEWRGLILVAAFTGLRLGDSANLRWDTIDVNGKIISLIPSKTRKKKRVVNIPIQTELLHFLKNAPSHGCGSSFVFPGLSGLAVNARDGLSLEFVRIMGIAGVSRGKPSRVLEEGENKGKGRITYERGFHSFRHTFTAWLRKAKVPEEDRMALTGHSTRESHAIYSHEDEKALRKAISKLPSLRI